MQVGNLITGNAGGGHDRKADLNSNIGRGISKGAWYGDRFVGLAGATPPGTKTNAMFYLSIGSLGTAEDFGDLASVNGDTHGTMSTGTRGVSGGGNPGSSPYGSDKIEYFNILSKSNAVDSNEITVARHGVSGTSNGHRGICAAGGIPPTSYDTIDAINLVTVQDAIDYGEFGFTVNHASGVSNGNRSLNGGGWIGSVSDGLRVFSFTTHSGTATDYGELSQGRSAPRGADDGSRGVFAAGTTHPSPKVTTMDFVSINTNGNAVDFGELNSVTSGGGSTSDGSRAVYAGGDGAAGLKTYYQIGTKGSSIEWGDLDFEFAGVGISGPAGAVSGG